VCQTTAVTADVRGVKGETWKEAGSTSIDVTCSTNTTCMAGITFEDCDESCFRFQKPPCTKCRSSTEIACGPAAGCMVGKKTVSPASVAHLSLVVVMFAIMSATLLQM
jgi:hypothetical protein